MQHDPVPGAEEDELLRQLAMIGAFCEPPQSDPAGLYKIAEAAPRENARNPQELQVSGGGGLSGCAVRLPSPFPTHSPAPSSTPSSTPSTLCENGGEAADQDTLLARLNQIVKAETSGGITPPAPTPAPAILAPIQPQAPAVTATATIGGVAFPPTAPVKPKRAANAPKMAPAWLRLSKAARVRASIEYAEAVGGLAVSLNLHPAKDTAYSSGCLKTSVRRLFRDALNRALDAAGIKELPYCLQFEASPHGRLHLHGVIDTHDRDPAAVDAIKLAMRKAAGQIMGKGAARQLCLKPITGAAGWSSYIQKAPTPTLAQLKQDMPPIISHTMARRAGNHHENARKYPLVA